LAANADIKDTNRQRFAAMANSVDDSIRAIVDTLKANGMWENTVLIVHTDNGGNLGGGGNNYPLRGGKYTFWQGGVRGVAFINSPLLPASTHGLKWNGLSHAVDMYTTIATLGGASAEMLSAGAVGPDGIDIWPSIVANTSSTRESLVLQMCSGGKCRSWAHDVTTAIGSVRKGDWKLIVGYPGWSGKTSWDGWIEPPAYDAITDTWRGERIEVTPEREIMAMSSQYNKNAPCEAKPCLFNVAVDPTEHDDVYDMHPDIVKDLMAIFVEEAATEVSVNASGLCPTQYFDRDDPRCLAKAEATGWWQPWLPDA
jgi:arylsulfatase A-like enzyme